MKTCSQTRWFVPAHASLLIRQWNDEYIVHHALSNDTHRISAIPGELVACLSTFGQQSLSDLARHIDVDEAETRDILEALKALDMVACR